MFDKLNEVSKDLGRTKKNSEAALRRYTPTHPKIERVRDIFDVLVPFEMEFETDVNDSIVNLDLYFNKPPPATACIEGNLAPKCEAFSTVVEVDGAQLVQVESYWPGTVTVFADNTQLPPSYYSEYSAPEGLVFIANIGSAQTITVCYIRTTWEYRCFDTTLNAQNTGVFSANHLPSDELSGAAYTAARNVDTDPTTSYPRINGANTSIADYRISITEQTALMQWTSHLGALENLPDGETNLAVSSSFSFSEFPATVNWENVTIVMFVSNVTGTHIGEFLDFFGAPPEQATMNIEVGHTRIELQTLHGDRPSVFPFLGPPQPARARMRFFNSGPRKWDYEIADNDDDSFSTDWFEFPFNAGVEIALKIHREANHISIATSYFSHSFPEPRFGDSGIFGVDINWSASCWLTTTAEMYGSVFVSQLESCREYPNNEGPQ